MRPRPALVLLPLLALLHPVSANATFHLNEITKVMVGLNGNNTVQAIELKMLGDGENQLAGAYIKVYDAGGVQRDSLGGFTGTVPNGVTGRFILCATNNFAKIFGITPDLLIKPGMLVGTGQVSFEKSFCFVNALAYGSVTTPKNGTTSAAALPTDFATALVRTVEDGILASCPLAEDAAARFQLRSGTSGTPITFTNNAGVSVNVFPTASGVDGSPPVATALRVYPNPFSSGARIVAPGHGYVSVYDVRGRMVRSWGSLGVSPAVLGPMRLDWDGTDAAGRRLASGIYFVQYGLSSQNRARVILLR